MIKLAVMKIICLLVLIGGLFMLGLAFDIATTREVYGQMRAYWPEDGQSIALNLGIPGGIAAVVIILIALYGLLPRFPLGKGPLIKFNSEHGEITMYLRPMRKVLLGVMRKMPEVYSIKLDVLPDADGAHARINADVVLKNCAALGARRCAKTITECLATTAMNVLGLEDLSQVTLNVQGVQVDIAATGKQLRERMLQRDEDRAAQAAQAVVTIEDVEEEEAVDEEQNEGVATEDAECEQAPQEDEAPSPDDDAVVEAPGTEDESVEDPETAPMAAEEAPEDAEAPVYAGEDYGVGDNVALPSDEQSDEETPVTEEVISTPALSLPPLTDNEEDTSSIPRINDDIVRVMDDTPSSLNDDEALEEAIPEADACTVDDTDTPTSDADLSEDPPKSDDGQSREYRW